MAFGVGFTFSAAYAAAHRGPIDLGWMGIFSAAYAAAHPWSPSSVSSAYFSAAYAAAHRSDSESRFSRTRNKALRGMRTLRILATVKTRLFPYLFPARKFEGSRTMAVDQRYRGFQVCFAVTLGGWCYCVGISIGLPFRHIPPPGRPPVCAAWRFRAPHEPPAPLKIPGSA